MDIQEVRLIGIAIAANYAACLESDNKFDFGDLAQIVFQIVIIILKLLMILSK